jgi:hypothetical protein
VSSLPAQPHEESRLKAAEREAAQAVVRYGLLQTGVIGGVLALLPLPTLFIPVEAQTWKGVAVEWILRALCVLGLLLVLHGVGGQVRRLWRRPAPARTPRLPVWPERQAQNPMTLLVDVKPGRVRQLFLSLLLRVINLRAVRYQRGLNVVSSIHFARWVLLPTPHGSQMLFLSNYDGSWDSYIADFTNLLSVFLNLAWCHTRGYPKTWLMFKEGAEDIEPFRRWIKSSEVPTDVWYCAHEGLSVSNLHGDLQLRSLISQPALSSRKEEHVLRVFMRTGRCLVREKMMRFFPALKVSLKSS